jgi:dienelactone hydrolase
LNPLLGTLIMAAMHPKRRIFLTVLLSGTLPGPVVFAQTLAPETATSSANKTTTVDEVWFDAARSRQVPIKIRWPDATVHAGPRPVVMFSHGLGGTTDGGAVWGEAWAAAGFVVLHLQHAGSDLAGVRALPVGPGGRRVLRDAAGPDQLIARFGDVGFALDEIGRRQQASAGRWAAVNPKQIGLAGHSFGAYTAFGMAGQRYPGTGLAQGVIEPRLAAFIALSPTVPATGDAALAFAQITRPMLCITGTLDNDVVGNGATPERRRAVFAALPTGINKAQLVLKDADHMTFAGQTGRAVEILPRVQVTRDLQTAHHTLVARITTDWWRAALLGDAAAQARLQTPAGLLPGDVWERD